MRSTHLPILLGALVLAGLPGCRDDPLQATRPELRLAPAALDFGAVAVGAASVLHLDVTNVGTGELVLTREGIGGDAQADWFQVSPARLEVPAGRTARFDVTFTPSFEAEAQAVLRLGTNEPDTEAHEVALTGIGYLVVVEVEPTSLDFGTLLVDTSLEKALVLKNLSDGPVRAVFESPTGLGAAQFNLDDRLGSDGGLTIGGGESERVAVTYAPTSSGSHQALLTAWPCDACNAVTVQLAGGALDSGLLISPAVLDFGMTRPGESLEGEVSFRNVGNVTLDITELLLLDRDGDTTPVTAFAVQRPSLPLRVEPGDETTISVVFTPTGLGPYEARLDWTSTDRRDQAGYVRLRGHGGAPWISVEPEVLDFGRTAVGLPVVRNLRVANVGQEALNLEELTVFGDGPFRLEDPLPDLIQPGEDTVVALTFEPTIAGAAHGGLHIRSNDPHDPELLVELVGDALHLPYCEVTLDEEAVDFGIVEPGQVRSHPVRLRNVADPGNRCLVALVSMADDDGGVFALKGGEVAGVILDGGESMALTLEFRPPGSGIFQGTLEVQVSDPDRPHRTVPLSGAAQDTQVLISPNWIDFGILPPGCGSNQREVCVYNVGPAGVTLTDVLVSGASSPVFTVSGLTAGVGQSGASIAPGAHTCFQIQFEAIESIPYTGRVDIVLDGFDRPFMVSLQGAGSSEAVQTETFLQKGGKADVLFVIPEYSSGIILQDDLAQNAHAFFDVLHHLGVDYQIGVISSGNAWLNDGADDGILEPKDRSRPHILTPSTPDVVSVFGANIQLGNAHTSGSSRHFWSAEKALRPSYLSDPLRNLGFVRPGAHLSLIVIGVYTENSHNSCGEMVFLEGCGTVEYFASILARSKGFRPATWSAHAFASAERYWELVEIAGGLSFTAYMNDPVGTDGGLTEENLAMAAPHAAGYRDRFPLANTPDPDTLAVHIVETDGGRAAAADWSYDADGNEIVFEPLSVPMAGERVEVTYVPLCGD